MVIHTIRQQRDCESSVSSLDLVSVDISQIQLNNRRSSFRCQWIKCGQWFPHLEMLATHVTHTHAIAGQNGLFFCGWEGCSRGLRGFNARYKMLVHVRTHTNEKPHHCFQCDKSFSRAENLKIHARSHTGERPYICPVVGCGKAYSNSSDRFKHTRTHSVDKPYVCKVPGCSKRYTDPSSLRKHVKTYRHFPIQTDEPNIYKSEIQPKTDDPNQSSLQLMMNPLETNSFPTTMVIPGQMAAVGDEMEPEKISSPGWTHLNKMSNYSSTPGSQPFPAWPGFLQPWYDNGIVMFDPWRTTQHRYRHDDELIIDMYDINRSRNSTAIAEDEQERPLDLTVQAK